MHEHKHDHENDTEPTHTDRHTHEQTLGRRQFVATTATVLAAGSVIAQPATAQQSGRGGLFADNGLASWSVATLAFVDGLTDGVIASARDQFGHSRSYRLQDYVDHVVDEYEDHGQDWLDWVNDRDLGSESRQSLEVTFILGDDEMTRYLLADYDPSEEAYADTTIVDEYEDTPDMDATLEGPAVQNAAYELTELHEEFIEPGKDISRAHASRLAGRYFFSPNDHVTSGLIGDAEEKQLRTA